MRAFYRPPASCQIPNLAGKWQAIFGRRNDGYFVEVGAYDGDSFSNSSCLADVGWSGLYIEPVAEFAERCRARHRNNLGVQVVEAAASDREGAADLLLGGALTTLDRNRLGIYDHIEWARGHHDGATRTVRTSTLDGLLEAHDVPSRFDLLVVDVEGAEEKVFAGFDLARWRPRVLVIELEDFHPDFQDSDELIHSAQRVRRMLRSQGYVEYHRDIINTVFIDQDAFGTMPGEVHFDAEATAPSRTTIGLPVHNGERTLRRTLDSILSQVFQNFDLIVSDNCSTDATLAIVKEYADKFERLAVRRHAKKLPAIENFGSLLEGCETPYFAWIADDDWWEPAFLRQCVTRLDHDPAAQLAFADYRIYYHFLDRYSGRHSHMSSSANEPQLNFMIRFFDMAPCAIYGVHRTATIQAVVRQLPDAFDFSDVVITLAVALRGKIEIVGEDLFRAGVRDDKSVVRRSIDGGVIKYGRFLRETCRLVLRELAWHKSLMMLPLIISRIYAIRRHYLSSLRQSPLPIEQRPLFRRDEVATVPGLVEFLQSTAVARGVSPSDVRGFNQRTRDAWVRAKAITVPPGACVLDVAAGTAPYRTFFAHCDYKTHDFAQYKSYQDGSEGKYTALDYVSDIRHIPVPDASFDVILCTEALEHVARPIEALAEMARIVKPGGRLLLTAPLGSGLHQEPYHFYGGYTPHWYRKFLAELGCEVMEITPNHGYFANLAQECCRFEWTFETHRKFHGPQGTKLSGFMANVLAPYLFAVDQEVLVPEFTVGFHVEARRCK